MHPEADFVDSHGRRLLQLVYGSASCDPQRRVVLVPPLMEELNKSRRLLALVARRMPVQRCEFIQLDLSGTGDSEGDFEDARWTAWADDLAAAIHRADARLSLPLVLLAVRGGALLLPALRARLTVPVRKVVVLQPVINGEQYLQQVLRLRVMASKFSGIEESARDLRALATQGEVVEVAGYGIGPSMMAALEDARLDNAALTGEMSAELIECRGGERPEPSVPAQRLAAAGKVAATAISCEQFWASQEIAAPLEAVDATVRACLND